MRLAILTQQTSARASCALWRRGASVGRREGHPPVAAVVRRSPSRQRRHQRRPPPMTWNGASASVRRRGSDSSAPPPRCRQTSLSLHSRRLLCRLLCPCRPQPLCHCELLPRALPPTPITPLMLAMQGKGSRPSLRPWLSQCSDCRGTALTRRAGLVLPSSSMLRPAPFPVQPSLRRMQSLLGTLTSPVLDARRRTSPRARRPSQHPQRSLRCRRLLRAGRASMSGCWRKTSGKTAAGCCRRSGFS